MTAPRTIHLSAWQEPTGLSWSDHRDYDAAMEEAGEAAIADDLHRYRGTIVVAVSEDRVRVVAEIDLTDAAHEYRREYEEEKVHSVNHAESFGVYGRMPA